VAAARRVHGGRRAEPTARLDSDTAYLKRSWQHHRPIIWSATSYGGAVLTKRPRRNANVKALVY